MNERNIQKCKYLYAHANIKCKSAPNNNNNNGDDDDDDDDDDDGDDRNFNNEKILLNTMLTIKILFTINSLEKKKNYSFKTLFTIPVDLKST